LPAVSTAVAPSPVAPTVAPPKSPLREASVESLLAAADAARADGRAADAVGLLRQSLDRHESDRRAPLAAFTLGRVLLMELARPREAAAAFAQARALAPHGAFAEDALAREVEAWAKAGEPVQARTHADEYRRLYPAGRRAAAVRSFGGLE
jgi:transmembrane sensor